MRIGNNDWILEVQDAQGPERQKARDYIVDVREHRAIIVDKGDSVRVAMATAEAVRAIYAEEGYATPAPIDNNVTLLDSPSDQFPLWEDGLDQPPDPHE